MWVLLLGIIAAGFVSAIVGVIAAGEPPRVEGRALTVQVALTMVVVALLCWRFGAHAAVLVPGSFTATAIPLAVADARTRRLSNRGLALMALLVTATVIITGVLTGNFGPLLRAVLGAAACLVFFGMLYILTPGGLGGGDVKLAGPLGAVLTWTSWSMLLSALLIGWGAAAIAHLISRLRGRKATMLPLGPFLVGGALVSLLVLPR